MNFIIKVNSQEYIAEVLQYTCRIWIIFGQSDQRYNRNEV